MTNAKIGERLRYLRNLRGLTIYDVEKYTNIAASVVAQYETAKIKNIPLDRLISLCNLYGASVDWVLTGKTEVPRDFERDWPAEFLAVLRDATTKLSTEDKHALLRFMRYLIDQRSKADSNN